MNVGQLKSFCSRLSGARVTLYAAPSNILVYSVGGKTFAYFKISEPERWRFSIQTDCNSRTGPASKGARDRERIV